jgi:hypothetical protein
VDGRKGQGHLSRIGESMVKGKAWERPAAGAIYAFKTKAVTRFSPQDTSRYGVLKILGVGRFESTVFVLLDRLFGAPPSPADVVGLKPQTSLGQYQRGRVLSLGVGDARGPPLELEGLQLVTVAEVTDAERQIVENTNSFGHWAYARGAAEIEWRWRNDPEVFAAEWAKEEAAKKEELAERSKRVNERLKNLTIPILRADRLLPEWEEGDPFPPPEFVAATRARILQTMDALEALGEKPGKPAVRKVLTGLMDWLNAKDAEFEAIETVEREQLCQVIEELCWAVGQPKLVEEILDLREW